MKMNVFYVLIKNLQRARIILPRRKNLLNLIRTYFTRRFCHGRRERVEQTTLNISFSWTTHKNHFSIFLLNLHLFSNHLIFVFIYFTIILKHNFLLIRNLFNSRKKHPYKNINNYMFKLQNLDNNYFYH